MCHPELKSTVGKIINVTQVKEVTKEKLTAWFNDVNKVFEENNINKKNVYNMDESGFSIRKINTMCVIINK